MIICLIVFNLRLGISYAQHQNPAWERCQPTYGGYRCGHESGWYGAKRSVNNISEAHDILVHFFSNQQDLTVGNIRENSAFFEAEIIDKNGALIDIVILHKKTGRIRSIY